jgi:transposase
MATKLYPVRLDADQRGRLEEIVRNGRSSAAKIRRANVLLMADHNRPGGAMLGRQIAAALGLHVNTIEKTRKRFVVGGEGPGLERKARQTPPVPAKLDGRAEAHLVATCCSPPPEGRARWTLRLLTDRLIADGFATTLSDETVRKTLKKTNFSLGAKRHGAFPNATGRASSRRWSRCSTPTAPRPPTTSR